MEDAKRCARRIAAIIQDCQRKIAARLSSELAKGHITIPQYQAILVLKKEEEVSMSEMAEHLCITTAAATSLVDHLVKQKLVERRRSVKDRRVVRVSLTPRGREVLDGVKDEMYRLILSVMEKLAPRERRTWVELYEKIRSLVEEGA